ncbi:MAG: hypothetical protein ACXVB9_05725 [Bdellovibrionota bacterium]
MKIALLMITLITMLSAPAFAWTGRDAEMKCEGKGGSIRVVMDTDKFNKDGYNLVGKFHSTDIDFWSKGKSEKGDMESYKDEKSGIVVKVLWPGPYDGDQDTFPGEISDGKTKVSMSCYHHSGGPDL